MAKGTARTDISRIAERHDGGQAVHPAAQHDDHQARVDGRRLGIARHERPGEQAGRDAEHISAGKEQLRLGAALASGALQAVFLRPGRMIVGH